MRWMRHVAQMRNYIKFCSGKREEKIPLGRKRHGWENNIKMDLKEIDCEDVDWTQRAQDKDWWWALMNTVMSPRVPQKVVNFLTV
jgi:hypothetical protein